MFELDQASAVKLIRPQDFYVPMLVNIVGRHISTDRKLKFQRLKGLPPATDNNLPHLITMRDVGVFKGFPEYHT
jgi:hypothetical protein